VKVNNGKIARILETESHKLDDLPDDESAMEKGS
jgi:hypothetical protein